MQLVDQIRFGPFSAAYHRALVNDDFKAQLDRFLRANLLPQLDSPLQELDGTLNATFDGDGSCGPSSLVRDIFTLDCVLICDDGDSDLKADIVYDRVADRFKPRTGRNHFFYVWTPARKARREAEMAEIQRVVDGIMHGKRNSTACPICGGKLFAINTTDLFDARCVDRHCFAYNFHKDNRGRLAHGHFKTLHPQKRGEQAW
jgi:hypothetical protein